MNRVGCHALSTKGWEVVFGRKEFILAVWLPHPLSEMNEKHSLPE